MISDKLYKEQYQSQSKREFWEQTSKEKAGDPKNIAPWESPKEFLIDWFIFAWQHDIFEEILLADTWIEGDGLAIGDAYFHLMDIYNVVYGNVGRADYKNSAEYAQATEIFLPHLFRFLFSKSPTPARLRNAIKKFYKNT